jgi:hypothetical protein
MRKTSALLMTVGLFTALASPQVLAGDFDGSKPLLCANIKVLECSQAEGCQEVTLEDVGLPQFSIIDFKEKTIRPTKESGLDRTTRIENLKRIAGKLIIQGAEEGLQGVREGLGWTIAISEESGRWVLTASGEGVAFVVYGACTPR